VHLSDLPIRHPPGGVACTLTLSCSSLDAHPNDDGSVVIAQAFEQAIP
jgi:hypothetical protein